MSINKGEKKGIDMRTVLDLELLLGSTAYEGLRKRRTQR